jgi:hypothetical protein
VKNDKIGLNFFDNLNLNSHKVVFATFVSTSIFNIVSQRDGIAICSFSVDMGLGTYGYFMLSV